MEEEGEGDESPAEDLGKDLDVDAEESDNVSEEGVVGVAGQESLRSSLSLPALSGSNVIRRPSMPGRKGRGSVTPYSTSSEESEAVEVRIRRRKKRKRPVGGLEKELRQKVAWIQDALKKGDRDRLGQLAASKGGLLSDEIRLRVWPALLGIKPGEACQAPTEQEIINHPSYSQVVLDVNRSLKRFPPGIEEAARPGLQEQLTRVIVRVLLTQPSLHYYQGYHDVAITFLLVVGEELAFHIMERLSISHLQQFMAPTMEQTMSLLELMYPLVQRSRPALHAHMEAADLGTIFALPWLITWFGHVLPDYSDVVRLYDFFLCSPPLMPIYLATAIVLHRGEEILQAEAEMSAIHSLLSKIPVDLPFEDLLVSCQELYESLPPHIVELEARVSREEKEKERMRERRVARGEKEGLSLFAQIVIISAPVFLGIVIWRLYGASNGV